MSETCEVLDVSCWLTWIFEELELFFLFILGSILDAIVYIIDLVPMPDFMTNVTTFSIPSDVAYFLNFFNLTYGLGILSSAYVARFIIRRLPVVG